jgi:hypothetical protein
MRPARKPTPVRSTAVRDFFVAPEKARLRAANDNALPDRAALIVVAIGQISAAIASISGVIAATLMLVR